MCKAREKFKMVILFNISFGFARKKLCTQFLGKPQHEAAVHILSDRPASHSSWIHHEGSRQGRLHFQVISETSMQILKIRICFPTEKKVMFWICLVFWLGERQTNVVLLRVADLGHWGRFPRVDVLIRLHHYGALLPAAVWPSCHTRPPGGEIFKHPCIVHVPRQSWQTILLFQIFSCTTKKSQLWWLMDGTLGSTRT